MDNIFLSPYNHADHEKQIYEGWEKSGFFNPDNLPGERKESFCVVMPPPNANGALHAGHAAFITLEDVMTRYARMRGKKALWVPGADHAGFETQVVYERKLQKEGRSRFHMERKEFYDEVLAFTLENKKNMQNQIRHMGASCDWSRDLFTLDERVVKQVYATFKKMYDDKLVYRGLGSVNWCPKYQTSLSNIELDYEERVDKFYYFQYGPFVIGTVRPETKFGDKYIVVHPDDERYAQYEHGQTFEVEWINGPIQATLLKDEVGDPEMGSGAMTITPWHSAIDWELAQKYNLEYEQIIDEKGKLLPIAEEFAGMSITEAREKIVEKMEQKGLVVKVEENYKHSVPICKRSGRDIEPQLKKQWFINMEPLRDKGIEAIAKEKVRFVTPRYKSITTQWLENLKDWNISRQIVWGIPIPAKICEDCGEGVVDLDDTVTECPACGSKKLKKDEDVFDTWFSSGQWPYIVLDYPNEDFKTFYPTSVMETAADILFQWVSRMVMLGLYRTGEVPFEKVYLHGLVLDEKGKKMSKSKGNVVDPVVYAEKFGTDALRLALTVANAPGEVLNLGEGNIRGYKKFCNKVWNIARFVFTETEGASFDMPTYNKDDQKHIDRVDTLAKEVTEDMERNAYHIASEKIYHYIWHEFADVIIEESKPILQKEGAEKESRQQVLMHCFACALKMLHPFAPFITETIWQHVPAGKHKTQEILMVEKWPV